jgi:tripartite-type tricarboxylate transporter receptor subunit TctC
MVQIKAGKVRPIATTGLKRSPLLPDVPTVSESLPGFAIANWWGLFTTAKTPQPIVTRINEVLVKGMQAAEVREKFAVLGVEATSSTPEELFDIVKSEMAAFAALIKAQNIKAQ